MQDATKKNKPAKPHADFPLYPHANGQWVKKIRGKQYCFGVWADPQTALNNYLADKEYLFAGEVPPRRLPPKADVEELCNRYLTDKLSQVRRNKITQQTWNVYLATCERFIEVVGAKTIVENLRPEDFDEVREEISKTRGPDGLLQEMDRIRSILMYGRHSGLVERHIRIGDAFDRPVRKTIGVDEHRRIHSTLAEVADTLIDVREVVVDVREVVVDGFARTNAGVASLNSKADQTKASIADMQEDVKKADADHQRFAESQETLAGTIKKEMEKIPADGPSDPGVFCHNGQQFPMAAKPWELMKSLWGKDAVSLYEIGEAIWPGEEGEKKVDRRITSWVNRTNDLLMGCPLPFEIRSPKPGFYKLYAISQTITNSVTGM